MTITAVATPSYIPGYAACWVRELVLKFASESQRAEVYGARAAWHLLVVC